MANKIAKKSPDCQGILPMMDDVLTDQLLRQYPVGKVWGIGGRLIIRLAALGIHTAADLRDAPMERIRKEMGIVGVRMVYELRGESCLPLEQCPKPRKQIVSSRSFGKPVENIAEVLESVSFHVSLAARKLRRQRSVSDILTVFFHTNPFKTEAPQYSPSLTIKMNIATSSTLEIMEYAALGVQKLFKPGYRYTKAGIMLDHLTSAEVFQGNLFDTEDRNLSARLMRAVDVANLRYGDHTVHVGTMGIRREWLAKFEMRTQRYTTSWDELVIVR